MEKRPQYIDDYLSDKYKRFKREVHKITPYINDNRKDIIANLDVEDSEFFKGSPIEKQVNNLYHMNMLGPDNISIAYTNLMILMEARHMDILDRFNALHEYLDSIKSDLIQAQDKLPK